MIVPTLAADWPVRPPMVRFGDPKAVMVLLGSELDYRESKMESGFVFNNPNEKGRCGCGESFST